MFNDRDNRHVSFSTLPLENQFNKILAHNKTLLEELIVQGDKLNAANSKINHLECRRREQDEALSRVRDIVEKLEGYKLDASSFRSENKRLRKQVTQLEERLESSESVKKMEETEAYIQTLKTENKALRQTLEMLK